MTDKILLYSGGLDSFIAWEYLNRPRTVYCAAGHRYEEAERNAIRRTIPSTKILKTVNLSRYEQPDAFVPLRNMFFVMAAALEIQSKEGEVVLVCQKDEMSITDRTEAFMVMMGAQLSLHLGKRITVTTPFAGMDKTDMVRWYINAGNEGKVLTTTRSCYSGLPRPCGQCPACFRRWVAMILNDVDDDFGQPPWKTDVAGEYFKQATNVIRSGVGKYSLDRAKRIIAAFEKVS